MPAVFVTLGPVQQQIFNRENFQPRQLRRAFRANAPKRGDGIFQRRNFIFRRRHRPHDTNRAEENQTQPAQSRSDGWKLARHIVPGLWFKIKIRPEGTVENVATVSSVPSGRKWFCVINQPLRSWLISSCPCGTKRARRT
jgi:hypothetical protein